MSGTAGVRAQLARELKALRARTGLSFAALGSQTLFSKSSWSRYLGGQSLPPWEAVQALCELAGEPEPRMRALWELAEREWSRRDAVQAPTPAPVAARAPGADSPPAVASLKKRTSARSWPLAALGVAVVSLALAGTVWMSSAKHAAAGPVVSCHDTGCDGLDPQPTDCGVDTDLFGPWPVADRTQLDLHYSPACHAAWGRVWGGAIGSTVTIEVAGRTRAATVQDLGQSMDFVYTMMVPVPKTGTPMRTCWTQPGSPPECHVAAAP